MEDFFLWPSRKSYAFPFINILFFVSCSLSIDCGFVGIINIPQSARQHDGFVTDSAFIIEIGKRTQEYLCVWWYI